MPPKLGPLSGRTFKSSSPAPGQGSPGVGAGGGGRQPSASGSPKRSASSSSSAVGGAGGGGSGGDVAAASSSSSSSSSPSRLKLNDRSGHSGRGRQSSVPPLSDDATIGSHSGSRTPFLLSREHETTYHRRLRTILIDFCRNRVNWETEVYDLAEVVGRYASCLGDIEDELRQKQEREKKKKRGKGKSRQVDNNDVLANADTILVESLRELEGCFAEVERGRQRMLKFVQAIVGLKDESRELESEWLIKGQEEVAWSNRSSGSTFGEKGLVQGKPVDDFTDSRSSSRNATVQAVANLSLQVQLQTAELFASLDQMCTRCSPLGSLLLPVPEAGQDGTRRSADPTYDPSSSSRLRAEILTGWRDLPHIERSGQGGFEWWREVWRCEVGRWDEFTS